MFLADSYKQRFSEDVLSQINKGMKFIGVCLDGSACRECYATGKCNTEDHLEYKWISYDEFVNEGNHVLFSYTKPSYGVFEYLFKDKDYHRLFRLLFHIRNLEHELNNSISNSS